MLSQSTVLSSMGYELYQMIGEGGHGRVQLAVHQPTQQQVAIKMVRKVKGAQGKQMMSLLLKEVKIHSSVAHENIIQLMTTSEDDAFVYLILEYAAGGELFDRIAPDVGLEEDVAHLYFTQLISGVKYLHESGIAHRDLKPENLLLDINGNLKMIDFGLATVFKYKGVTRILSTPCGSPPYVCPEIHLMKYMGDMADIWSCGVILYVMLAGNTPWAEPISNDEEFTAYVRHYSTGLFPPWNQFPAPVLELLRGILNINVDERYTIQDIQQSQWFNRPQPMLTNGKCNNPKAIAEKMKSKMNVSSACIVDDSPMIAYSQPMDMRMDLMNDAHASNTLNHSIHGIVSFSQPNRTDVQMHDTDSQCMVDMHLNSSKGAFVDIFPSERMTRFYTQYAPTEIYQRICATFEQFLVPFRFSPSLIIFSTVDKRKCPLHGEVYIQNVGNDDMSLVTFRKSRGDPLEFKRFYQAVRESLEDLIFQAHHSMH